MEGAVEVKQALERGQISGDDMRTSTLKYYRHLLDAERILEDVCLKGRVF
jgi:hypothetical protein